MADETYDPIADLQRKIEHARAALQKAVSDNFIPARFGGSVQSEEQDQSEVRREDARTGPLEPLVDLPHEGYTHATGVDDAGWFVQEPAPSTSYEPFSLESWTKETSNSFTEFSDPFKPAIGVESGKDAVIRDTIDQMDVPATERVSLEREIRQAAHRPKQPGPAGLWPPGGNRPQQLANEQAESQVEVRATVSEEPDFTDTVSVTHVHENKQFAGDIHGRGTGNASPVKFQNPVTQQQAVQGGHSRNYSDHVSQDMDVSESLNGLVSQVDVLSSSLAELIGKMTVAIQGLHGRVMDMTDRLDAESDLDEFGSGF